ncbi:MAG: HNH endonuclease [Gammaproteobacteria bacterium]|nr:HNH endonuclease [Gammaproteobacteria bacterium]MCP4981032.1 HNH endonuclease [Gammaproteobacteria bacterium]
MQNAKILRLNKAGTPIEWISREEAATLVVKDQVVWALGEDAFVIRGGINRLGRQSILSLPSILASDGRVKLNDFVPPLVNSYLFRRDQFLCMYCGGEFRADNLSRDHILPVSRKGTDNWTNVVTACKRCNHRKANRTPEEAGMELLAVPFVPNRYEFFYLANKNILADQMEFLKSQFSQNGNCFLSIDRKTLT